MRSFMVTLWKGWKAFAHKLIAGQNWIIMALAYLFAMGPVSLLIKRDPERRLDRAPAEPDAESYGLPYGRPAADVRSAQRPW